MHGREKSLKTKPRIKREVYKIPAGYRVRSSNLFADDLSTIIRDPIL